nr:chloroplast sensor kinase, chloroplastic [Tanacetum cinerariifolium]
MLLSITPHHHHLRHNHFKPPVVHCLNPNSTSNLRRVSNENGACEGTASLAAAVAASSSAVEFVERICFGGLSIPMRNYRTIALVFPMVKHPFVVRFLVAELPKLEIRKEEDDVKPCSLSEDSYAVYPYSIPKS